MSKPRTHYAMPMTMGRSICHIVMGRTLRTARGVMHYSPGELVGTIEETTCKFCHRAYYGDNPPCKRCGAWSETWPDGECPNCGSAR